MALTGAWIAIWDSARRRTSNLLPIPRLALNVGEEGTVAAAWLAFPTFRFELLPQVYCRNGERTYHYESHGGFFVKTLEVNDAGPRDKLPEFVAGRIRSLVASVVGSPERRREGLALLMGLTHRIHPAAQRVCIQLHPDRIP